MIKLIIMYKYWASYWCKRWKGWDKLACD